MVGEEAEVEEEAQEAHPAPEALPFEAVVEAGEEAESVVPAQWAAADVAGRGRAS